MPHVSTRAQAVLVLCAVLLLRLPFLNQAIQGDDFYYLKGAEHAQIDPLHPTHARYVFLGQEVDMRGHPHPPLDTWILGALLAAFKDIYEIPFHALYIAFSVLAGFSTLALARRFCDRPLLATSLFLVTPPFVINGNSLESDVPFVALWLVAIALFIYERYAWAAVAASLAALAAYQAVLIAPVLWAWLLLHRNRRKSAWLATLAAPGVIVLWQVYERASGGALPAGVLAGYMQTYNLQALTQKIKNAIALTGHSAWIVFPLLAIVAFRRGPKWIYACAVTAAIGAAVYDPNPLFWASCGIGVWILGWCAGQIAAPDPETKFLAAWVVVFFAAALIIFFAGSARYLLPIAAPVSFLVARNAPPRWIWAGIAAQAVVAILLAIVNYQHWGGYREFAEQIQSEIAQHRTWTNAEWGLRYYLESQGALPIARAQSFRPGDLIVTTVYTGPAPIAPPPSVIAQREITSAIPLRLIAPGARSGYSSIAFGLRPFDISLRPMDVVRAAIIADHKPELSWLKIGTPDAAPQILFGIYDDRWTADKASVIVKRPPGATRAEAIVFVPQQAAAKELRMSVDGNAGAKQTIGDAGQYTITAPAGSGGNTATIAVQVDRTFSVPADQRQLGVILLEIGLR